MSHNFFIISWVNNGRGQRLHLFKVQDKMFWLLRIYFLPLWFKALISVWKNVLHTLTYLKYHSQKVSEVSWKCSEPFEFSIHCLVIWHLYVNVGAKDKTAQPFSGYLRNLCIWCSSYKDHYIKFAWNEHLSMRFIEETL